MTLWSLAWLDLKRTVRSWRWRALVGLALMVAYFFQRGPGFWESAAAFPGGAGGVRWIGLLLAAGGLVLAVDLAGQTDRFRARAVYDALPVSGWVVQAARLLAIFFAVSVVAVLVVAVPFLPFYWEERAPLIAPSLIFLATVLLPAIFAAAAAGLLGRAVTRNDGGGVIAALLFAAPYWFLRLIVSSPEQVFTTATPYFGVLVPREVLLIDALIGAMNGLFLCALAGIFWRRLRGISIADREAGGGSVPQRVARAMASRATMLFRQRILASILLLLVCLPAILFTAWSGNAYLRRGGGVTAVDFAQLREPSGADGGIIHAMDIVNRRMGYQRVGVNAELAAYLTVRNAGELTQEVAAFAFGSALELVNSDPEFITNASSPKDGLFVFRLKAPLAPGEITTLRMKFRAAPSFWRQWARTAQREYATFAGIPLWWGEPVRLNYPLGEVALYADNSTLELWFPPEREWFAGHARKAESWRDEKGNSPYLQETPGRPAAVFSAQTYVAEATYNGLTVRYLVFPGHERIADGYLTIYDDDFNRLEQAFGAPSIPLIYYETPDTAPMDPMAMSTSFLDLTDSLYPKYNDVREPSAPAFELAFEPYHRAAIEAIFDSRFGDYDDRRLLRHEWIEYLHQYAFNKGRTLEFRSGRRHYVFVPWEWMTPKLNYPFDVRDKDIASYSESLLADWRSAARIPSSRYQGFHHMLRALLGEEKYRLFMRSVFSNAEAGDLTMALFQDAAEEQYGESLDWFFEQWLAEGVLPRYRIKQGEVVLVEKNEGREIEYQTTVTFANEGTGRMPVPLVLQTETEDLERRVWMGPGETLTERFTSRSRPISFAIDPLGQIVQEPIFNPRTKRIEHARIYLKKISAQRRE